MYKFPDVELSIKPSSLRKIGLVISFAGLLGLPEISFLSTILRDSIFFDYWPLSFIILAFMVACGWWMVAGAYLYLSTIAMSLLAQSKTRLARIASLTLIALVVLILPCLGVMFSIFLMSGGSIFTGGID